jgi:threonine synthase
MRYISSRGAAPSLDFENVTLAGLASDGGLYVPESWPSFSPQEIAALRGLSYVETAVAVMRPFVAGSLDDAALRALCEAAYGRFSHAAVTPLVQLDARHWLLELFHGPTLAFKDVALQLLGLLFERDQRRYRVGGDRRAGRPRQGGHLHASSAWSGVRRAAPTDDHGARAQCP